MREHEDSRWMNLLALGAPAFAGEIIPPYGLVTRTMARLRAESRQTELAERIGLRALFVSLAVLFCAVTVLMEVRSRESNDLEPGMRNIIQVENVPFS